MPVPFNDRPNCTTRELQQELKRVLGFLEPAPVIVRDVSIGTTSTAVRFGGRFVARAAVFVPHDLCTWARAEDPAPGVVYLKASVAVTGDVLVFP